MYQLKIEIRDGEFWYGIGSVFGVDMPISKNSKFKHDMRTNYSCNQESPLMLSSDGRYIWSDGPFLTEVKDGVIALEGTHEILLCEGFGDLRGAFLAASKAHFPANGELPAENFFKKPQYNTWIELIYDQNQADVLKYAHSILDNGLPPGIIMIDDNWNYYYGRWDFNRATFPDPRAMVDELHAMGFEVMVWVCPFISADSREYRYLRDKGYLLRDPYRGGAPALRGWWNGYSAELDLTNPGAVEWFTAQLDRLQTEYGIDGFKFDAGEVYFYGENDITYAPTTPHEQCERWAKFGLKYKYNEYRACFKCAGLPLVQRLCDKKHAWKEGVATLIPNTLAQGILGYAFTCPDMIGGGDYVDFLPETLTLDMELFVRSAQASALLPMMQYSAAPWRILDREHADYCIHAGELHVKYADEVFELVKAAANTCEPVIRYMEYVFPHMGYGAINDQFMLGEKVLCAPVVEKGARERTVVLPAGEKWKYCDGTVYEGGQTVTVAASLDTLPYFERV